jgi:twitching motility protein PilT
MNLRQMLVEMLSKRASDLHLRVGIRPTLRVDGKLDPINVDPLSKDEMSAILSQMLSDDQRRRFQQRNEMDLALSVTKLGRFRINLYRQRGTPGIAIRGVNTEIPSFDELNLPDVIRKIADARRGLVIVTGTTGSGKSTTLASMIEHINETRRENILTVEDPIEFIFRDKNSIVLQREVGGDTPSFSSALRHAFRQDPDVIMIGEIRDQDTMATALAAADTGHLVLTTLHTMNAIETISRIISFFPPHQHQQIRLLLSGTLQSVICQRLLARSDSQGRTPAVEVLIGTASVREYLADETKTPAILELIESGMIQYGMQSFDQSIMKLYQQGVISYEDAMAQATNPDDFDLRLKGITGSSDRGWTEYSAVSEE